MLVHATLLQSESRVGDIAMELLDLAPRQRWSSLAARATSHPNEIRAADPSGLTSLHWACFNRPPLSAVRALLDNAKQYETENDSTGGEYADARPQQLPLVALADTHGTTSLHAACSSHASPQVVAALVESYPPSVRMQDEMGWSSLHYLCGTAFASTIFSEIEGRESLESVKILIRTDQQCVEIVDYEGKTALDLLCEVMGAHHDPGWQFGRRRIRTSRQHNGVGVATAAVEEMDLNGTRRSESTAEECFWSLAKELITAMYCSSKAQYIESGDVPQVLHQCLALRVPADLIRYVLARYPEQAYEVHSNNDSKQLPLHIVACTNTHTGTTVNDILIANPGAAKMRDGEGKLPLQRAIESKRTWNNGPCTLLCAYPDALGACRLGCTYYPFILSKTLRNTSQATKSISLTTAFRILRAKPDLVEQQSHDV
mmetsp:Transcript_22603/g.49068  ORF Transcript_22603/g.49068 Transcript_22603/m.49068 type:complete len:430 (-) Transcript_22603:94-1383(-)